MNRLHGGKRISILLAGAAFVALFAVLFVVPKPAHAATAQWINRFYIVADGQNYRDPNTYDGDYTYLQETTNTCKNKIVFTFSQTTNNGTPSNNLRFFFNDADYNKYTKKYITSTPGTNTAGQPVCNDAPAQDITVGGIGGRKYTFYRDGNKITNIGSGVTFSKTSATDSYKGSERFFRDDEKNDANNSCPDMILLHQADVMSDGDAIFGNGPVGDSSLLFAVIKDDSLSRVSETYAIDSQLSNINQGTCHVRSDSMDKNKGGEFAVYSTAIPDPSRADNSADRMILAAGIDGAGNANPDDAFITFIGTTNNVKKDPTTGAVDGTPADTGTVPGGSDAIDDTICRGQGLGWIICPIATAIQTASDLLSKALQSFLTVNPLPIGSGTIYDAWNNVRNLANIAFVLAFFAIIFSQATSIGISNYGIKRLLPRLVLVAIATNVSYFLCSFLVDAFNILGVGVQSVFAIVNGGAEGVITPGSGEGIIFGGSIAALIAFAFGTGAIVEVIPFVVAAFLGLVVVFIVLVARQSLIILLVVFSPLAFVAALLPGTQQWFSRWMNMFVGMLVMYPAVMALFAAGRLASSILSGGGG
jgi:hypothetical protein